MHHDLDTPLQVEEWRFDRRQPAGVDCPPQLQPGKAADAQPGLHRLADRLRLFEFESNIRQDAGVAHRPIKDLARTSALLAQNPDGLA